MGTTDMPHREYEDEILAKCENVDYPIGWRELVIQTHCKLKAIDPEYELWQIKEKLGGLRYYADPSEDIDPILASIFRDIIYAAEVKSRHIHVGSGEVTFPWKGC